MKEINYIYTCPRCGHRVSLVRYLEEGYPGCSVCLASVGKQVMFFDIQASVAANKVKCVIGIVPPTV
jgi:hypothetical protein